MATSRRVLPGDFVCLPTSDPLLCQPDQKPRLEARNTLRQLLNIEELVDRGVREVRESHVHGFHSLAVDGIFPCGGQFRVVTRTAEMQGGQVVHVPPEPALVPGYVRDAVASINSRLTSSREQTDDARRTGLVVDAAAYALWRFNWIHPFAGGNGRTARALAYLILCIDYGAMIPGKPSMPTLIAGKRRTYQTSLREADAAEREGGENLSAMSLLVNQSIMEQIRHALYAVEHKRSQLAPNERATRRRKDKAARAARRKSRQ